jgi:hypothetical protein
VLRSRYGHTAGNEPVISQAEHLQRAQARSARADQTMLDLLFGPNPITDDELRKLIAKRPEVYGRYAGYLGKR